MNELRPANLRVGFDIEAHDNEPVYALAPGVAHIIAATGPDERVGVGQFITGTSVTRSPKDKRSHPTGPSSVGCCTGFGTFISQNRCVAGILTCCAPAVACWLRTVIPRRR